MNSLEFIKQHITEWPTTMYQANHVTLYDDGNVCFANPTIPFSYHTVDLSEHFSPDYYDGEVWTHGDFELCGDVEYRYNESLTHPLLKREDCDYYYHDDEKWCEYIIINMSDWEPAIKISDSVAANYIKQGEFEASSTGIDATVEERGNRYGTFKDGADIIQELKSVMRSTPNWSKLTPSQREALEMIQHKVGRILNGDPNYTDSWHDIKGYAHLIEEELNGNAK